MRDRHNGNRRQRGALAKERIRTTKGGAGVAENIGSFYHTLAKAPVRGDTTLAKASGNFNYPQLLWLEDKWF